MFQTQIRKGSRVVIITANDKTGPFNSRLYVNGGEDITLLCRKAKTLDGAKKQALKLFEIHDGK